MSIENQLFAYAKTKTQISYAVTAADQHLCFRNINSTIPLHSKSENFQPLAIFCGCTAWFMSDLVKNPENRCLFHFSSAKGLKEGILTSSGGTITRYCNKVFGAWDFCITSEKTADIRNKNILQGLQVIYCKVPEFLDTRKLCCNLP